MTKSRRTLPLRYRGYYYDTNLELYYLQSRYYSPSEMRFISQDDPVLSNGQGQPLGSNLYAYCMNNPVMHSDPSGTAVYKLIAVGIQVEVCIGFLTVGIEVIWYISPQVKLGKRNRAIPYVYSYGASSAEHSAKTKAIFDGMIKRPKLLNNPKALAKGGGISICIFAIFGKKTFASPDDYLKWSKEVYGTAAHIKAYTSYSEKFVAVGIGWCSTYANVGYSTNYYCYVQGFNLDINKIYKTILKKGKKIRR